MRLIVQENASGLLSLQFYLLSSERAYIKAPQHFNVSVKDARVIKQIRRADQ